MAFQAIYFLQNFSGTYQALDTEGNILLSGASLVSDVLDPIEAANSSGGFACFFGVGTFDMGTENWTPNGLTGVLLEGVRAGVTTIENDSDAVADTEPFSFIGCDQITVMNMSINAQGTERSTSDALDFDKGSRCVVKHVEILGSRGRGIVFDGKDAGALADHNLISDCHITGCPSGGIELLAARYNIIEGNQVYSNGDGADDHGIQVLKASPGDAQANKKASFNTIRDNQVYSNGGDGINVISSDGTIISGNHVYNNSQGASTRDGIRTTAVDSITADNTIISGNYCVDTQGSPTQQYGIDIDSSDCNDTIILGNVVTPNKTGGVDDGGTDTLIRSNTGAADN